MWLYDDYDDNEEDYDYDNDNINMNGCDNDNSDNDNDENIDNGIIPYITICLRTHVYVKNSILLHKPCRLKM